MHPTDCANKSLRTALAFAGATIRMISILRRHCRRLRRGRVANRYRRAVLDLDLTRGDDPLAGLEPIEDHHLIARARPGLDRGAHRLVDRDTLSVFAVLADRIDAGSGDRLV